MSRPGPDHRSSPGSSPCGSHRLARAVYVPVPASEAPRAVRIGAGVGVDLCFGPPPSCIVANIMSWLLPNCGWRSGQSLPLAAQGGCEHSHQYSRRRTAGMRCPKSAGTNRHVNKPALSIRHKPRLPDPNIGKPPCSVHPGESRPVGLEASQSCAWCSSSLLRRAAGDGGRESSGPRSPVGTEALCD